MIHLAFFFGNFILLTIYFPRQEISNMAEFSNTMDLPWCFACIIMIIVALH